VRCKPWPCSDDWRIRLVLPILWLIDALLQQRPLAERLFNRFRSPDNIRKILQVLLGGHVVPGAAHALAAQGCKACCPSAHGHMHLPCQLRGSLPASVQGVYSNKEAVDEELVQLIYGPSCDEGALDAFISILTGDNVAPGPKA
jgi:hypothetical protein